jgi:hypothetical protein
MNQASAWHQKGGTMADEIELLRLFRDEMPGPSAGAWARAESAIAAARSEGSLPGSRRRWASRLPASHLARSRLAVGIAAAVAAAALTIALLPGSEPAGRAPVGRGSAPAGTGSTLPAIESRRGLPSAALVGKAMLTAFSAANDDILYSIQTGINRGVVVDIYRDWSWPAQPVTGRQERYRSAFTERISRTAPLKLTEDDGFIYLVPPANWNYATGRLTVVCYAGTGQTGCGYGDTETPPGTWSQHYGRFVNPNPGLNDLRPAALAREIADGQWRVTGRTHLNGQQAIELTQTPAGFYQPPPTLLWVNAHTYLPLRMIQGANKPESAQVDWYFLKPTAANLALLRVPIPAGYRRSGPPGT